MGRRYLARAGHAKRRASRPSRPRGRPGPPGRFRHGTDMTSTEKLEAFLAEPRNVVVAGIRRDGSPHLSPNWFYWDGTRFYVSITRSRVKYKIFTRDPRVELLIDDSTAFRAVLVPGTVEIRED